MQLIEKIVKMALKSILMTDEMSLDGGGGLPDFMGSETNRRNIGLVCLD